MTDVVPIDIVKVLELEGVLSIPDGTVSACAYLTSPVILKGYQETQYALIASYVEHGEMQLGRINPQTRGVRSF